MAGIRATLELEIPGVGVLRLPWHGVTMDPACSGGAVWLAAGEGGRDSGTGLSARTEPGTDGSTRSTRDLRSEGAAAVRALRGQRQRRS